MILPTRPTKFTLRDLTELLKKIPRPDLQYWDVVEDINRKQQALPESLREG